MLSELRLSNFGVVAEAALEFEAGLTALTGETGAGKTMLVAGLGLLLGGRGDAGVVRHGSDKARVEGRWLVSGDLAERVGELGGDLDNGDELVTLRQISAAGRSRAMAGGAQVPVSVLGELAAELATIHGQSEQIRLGTSERQREILDAYARPAALADYRRDYEQRRALRAELDELIERAQSRAREIDMLRFGLEEIDAVMPQAGEDAQLAAEALRLQDAEELKQEAQLIQLALSGSEHDFDAPNIVAMAGEARKKLNALADQDALARPLAERLEEITYLLNDLAADVAGYETDLVSDPVRLEAVAQRRAALAHLQRKYGPELDDVIAWAETARAQLQNLEGADERIDALRAEVAQLDARVLQGAEEISRARRAAAGKLHSAVQTELVALAMPHAQLRFELTPVEPGPHGADRVELLFTANPGSAPAPLGKVASGGELSRVRLALEVVLAGQSPGHTFVFDEVDAGVGGAVGLEIGRRLKRLAATTQVIVVTHLAQVAAFADHHFVVSKRSDGQVTTSGIRALTQEERRTELARMMSGAPDSEVGTEHAAELLAQAGHPTT